MYFLKKEFNTLSNANPDITEDKYVYILLISYSIVLITIICLDCSSVVLTLTLTLGDD